MVKPSRWNGEKRYQIVNEALSQKLIGEQAIEIGFLKRLSKS